jgi:hypothetical protein
MPDVPGPEVVRSRAPVRFSPRRLLPHPAARRGRSCSPNPQPARRSPPTRGSPGSARLSSPVTVSHLESAFDATRAESVLSVRHEFASLRASYQGRRRIINASVVWIVNLPADGTPREHGRRQVAARALVSRRGRSRRILHKHNHGSGAFTRALRGCELGSPYLPGGLGRFGLARPLGLRRARIGPQSGRGR